jgi:hypothetical protein
MFKPVSVEARPGYHLWIRYRDGNKGEIDLSELVGRGVFELWKDEEQFKRVNIAEDGAIRWNEEVELCPDALYFKLTNQNPEQAFPKMNSELHA